MNDKTTIQVSKELHEKLYRAKRADETFEDFIRKLLGSWSDKKC